MEVGGFWSLELAVGQTSRREEDFTGTLMLPFLLVRFGEVGVEGKIWAAVSVISDSVELRLASSRSLSASSAVFIGTSSSLKLVLPEASAPDLVCYY